jgi:hypothetical protein
MKDLRKAVQLRRAGKKRQALALLFDLVRNEKTNPDVWFYLAVTLDNLSRESRVGWRAILRCGREGDEPPKGQVGSFYQNGKDGARWHRLAHFHAALRLKTGKFREKSGTGFQ